MRGSYRQTNSKLEGGRQVKVLDRKFIVVSRLNGVNIRAINSEEK
jgi:hypothetical protein